MKTRALPAPKENFSGEGSPLLRFAFALTNETPTQDTSRWSYWGRKLFFSENKLLRKNLLFSKLRSVPHATLCVAVAHLAFLRLRRGPCSSCSRYIDTKGEALGNRNLQLRNWQVQALLTLSKTCTTKSKRNCDAPLRERQRNGRAGVVALVSSVKEQSQVLCNG